MNLIETRTETEYREKVRKLNLRLFPAKVLVKCWRKGEITNEELKKLVTQEYLRNCKIYI